MRVYIIDPHPIYRRGLVACLAALDEVDEVWEADGPRAAELDENLELADVLSSTATPRAAASSSASCARTAARAS